MTKNSQVVLAESLSKRSILISTVTIGVVFFVIGFTSWVNSILIPYFKIACELNNFESYLVTFAFYISYFIMSVPAAYLLKAKGFKDGMMIGFCIMAFGAFLFIPAALSRTYGIFLLGLFSIGTGLSILQTAANPYVTILGDKKRAAQRISIMGICNKTAGILAPLIFASVILRVTDGELFKQLPLLSAEEKKIVLDELIRRVIVPYSCLGVLLLTIGIGIHFSPLPEIDTDRDVAVGEGSHKSNVFQFPHLVLGAIAIFLHVGSQVIAIDTIIGYATSMNISLLEAKIFPSYTLFMTICGYLIGIACMPKLISQLNALRVCTFLGLSLSFFIIFARGESNFMGHQADISIWFIVLLGLANSMIWAGIWPLALDGLGRFVKIGSSIMIMGLCGNAIMPLIYGYVADKYDLRHAYWVLVPCYAYLCFYAIYGYKLRSWKKQIVNL